MTLSKDELSKIIAENYDNLIVVKFSAPWCGPCHAIAPLFKKLCTNKKLQCLNIDIDESPDIAEDFNISSIPAFKFIKKAKIVDSFIGADANKLKTLIVKHLKEKGGKKEKKEKTK